MTQKFSLFKTKDGLKMYDLDSCDLIGFSYEDAEFVFLELGKELKSRLTDDQFAQLAEELIGEPEN